MRCLTSSDDAAQGDREVLLVDLLEHHLDRAVVELDDVLEGEQQQADLVGELAVGLRELVEHVALRRAVGVVEDVGQRLHAARGGVLRGDDVRELLLHDRLDLGDHVRPRLAHQRHARGDVGLVLGRQQGEHLRGERGVQVGHHERDGLRRLVLAGRRGSAPAACGAGTRTAGARWSRPGGR